MSWNYRIVKQTARKSKLPEEWFDPTFSILEVFYGHDGKPHSWSNASVMHFDDERDLRDTLDLMRSALTKPILEICPSCERIDDHQAECARNTKGAG